VSFSKDLNRLSDEQLLRMRFRDLPLSIEGTHLENLVATLYQELEAKGLLLRPHIWLSEEWFTPDDVPGFAIPFYLAHPRLIRLERKELLEVEGGTKRECLRIMRHEAGHAIDNAFGLHVRRRYRELFGSFNSPYPEWYKPEPNSRSFVFHLPAWYAQAHPAEDFAETFAVWIRPGSSWRKRYAGWPVIRKLEYVDRVMRELAGQMPINQSQDRVEELSEIDKTLQAHYDEKREHYALQWPPDYDRALLRIFTFESENGRGAGAAEFLRRHRRELCSAVAAGTGVHRYAINQMLSQMINRCRELKLGVSLTQDHTWQKVLVTLTVQTINGIHSGYHRIAL
jgi:hypothetical protein